MEPTFRSGQWLLLRRANWPSVPLRHGDIVVFRHDDEILIKRVAALPGEMALVEDYGPIRFREYRDGGIQVRRLIRAALRWERVPEGQVYVLGDNTANSEDSRYFGPIPASTVIGRVVPWEYIGSPGDPQPGPTSTPLARTVNQLRAPVLSALAAPTSRLR